MHGAMMRINHLSLLLLLQLARALAALSPPIPPALPPHFGPAPGLDLMPAHMVLSASFTPFCANGTLNATSTAIDRLAAQAAAFGVTTVWVPGTMGQFDALSISERKTLIAAWVPAAKAHGLYLIAHVGTSSTVESAELARHARDPNRH